MYKKKLQDLAKSKNQNLNRGRMVIAPRDFRPGMPVIQTVAPHLWYNVPRATVLGERGSRLILIRSDPDGPYLSEERRSEVFAPAWALQEEFENDIPENMHFLDQNPEPDE